MLSVESLITHHSTLIIEYMFKREVKPIGDLLKEMLRKEGLETPLLQRRIVP